MKLPPPLFPPGIKSTSLQKSAASTALCSACLETAQAPACTVVDAAVVDVTALALSACCSLTPLINSPMAAPAARSYGLVCDKHTGYLAVVKPCYSCEPKSKFKSFKAKSDKETKYVTTVSIESGSGMNCIHC